jgi:hypothetical protein
VTTATFGVLLALVVGHRATDALARIARGHARMVAVDALVGVGWLGATLFEVYSLERPFVGILCAIGAVWVAAGQIVLQASIASEPSATRNAEGIHRYFTHPRELGAFLVVVGLPLVHAAWTTATVFAIVRGVIAWRRTFGPPVSRVTTSRRRVRWGHVSIPPATTGP